MHSLRKILVGLIIGGAFGARIGAYMHSIVEDAQLSMWSSIEFGFLTGAAFGLVLALSILFIRSAGVTEKTGSVDVSEIPAGAYPV